MKEEKMILSWLFKKRERNDTEQRCSNCGNLLCKNLNGYTEIKCRKCKKINKIKREYEK